jgi:hypothetical protein
MVQKDEEIIRLLLLAEEKKTVENRLLQKLEEYEEEHRSMKTAVQQLFDVVRRVGPKIIERCEAGVRPERVPCVQGPNIKDSGSCMEDMVIDPADHSASPSANPKTTGDMLIEQDAEMSKPAGGENCNDLVRKPEPTTLADKDGSIRLENLTIDPNNDASSAPHSSTMSELPIKEDALNSTSSGEQNSPDQPRPEQGRTSGTLSGPSPELPVAFQPNAMSQKKHAADDPMQNTPCDM